MKRGIRLIGTAAVIWLVFAGSADAGRFAIGIAPSARATSVAAAVAKRTGSCPENLGPIRALVVTARRRSVFNGIDGIRYVERLRPRRLAFTPTDPLATRQWYLTRSGFYQSWVTLPSFEPVPVAVIDSGVDAGHPELAGKILSAKSFVGGSARVDTLGHGTFVAGLIAAGVDNGVGIAGLAPSAQLLVAKVVTPSRAIPVDAEARAIRWAVDNGARVINMSLGGLRDPLDPTRDSYSQLEADAVAYAVSSGAVVVAAAGNDDQAPTSPWPYASYPAALPHVIGVSAYGESGAVPRFSNRDRIFVDLAAPGEDILSIFPRQLTARYPACEEQGYSSCGPDEYRSAEGTSFAAPQVSAAAAVLLSLHPWLRPEQVSTILERTAQDLNPATGCDACPIGRDALSGWGSLDVEAAIAALDGPLPTRDRYEPNDDAGSHAFRLSGTNRRVNATLDFWDDQDDIYGVPLHKGQRVFVGMTGTNPDVDLSLALWLPETRSVQDVHHLRLRVRVSARPGSRQYLSYRAPKAGTYFLQVRISSEGSSAYRLSIAKGR